MNRAVSSVRPASTRWLASCALLMVLLSSGLAQAITQPDGTTVPVGRLLQTTLDARGETIDVVRAAAVTPERFVPGCGLTFTRIDHGGAVFRDAFGWYNVTGSRPATADLHVLIPCGSPAGFVATLDLRTDRAYRGGEIGFFLRTPQLQPSPVTCAPACCGSVTEGGQTYFTERRYNPDNHGASSYVHLLTYDSRVESRAFYFAWEDLYSGGDNNFTDFIALVQGITCSGGGAACDTGARGVCGPGTQQCRDGALQCIPVTTAGSERCDGLDNDCNGTVDDGNSLCPGGEVCDQGQCVGRCVEDSCFDGFACSARGTCVETACVHVECAVGQVCHGGRCGGPCDGVRCPTGLVCRADRCVDPCDGVTCDTDQVCTDGLCRTTCACQPCGSSMSCAADGRCESQACSRLTCADGQQCSPSGTCLDACAQAVCPHGEPCALGRCIEPDAGAPPRDDGVADASGPLPDRDACTRLDAPGPHPDATTAPAAPASFGCGCRTTPTRPSSPLPLLPLLLLTLRPRKPEGRC